MSLKSWKEEFYPIEASETLGWVDIKLVEHSIKKWIGLRKENLNKHECKKYPNWGLISDEENSLDIDTDTCALCINYFKKHGCCDGCTLFKSCEIDPCYGDNNLYGEFSVQNDPEPMIKALEHTLEILKEQSRTE